MRGSGSGPSRSLGVSQSPRIVFDPFTAAWLMATLRPNSGRLGVFSALCTADVPHSRRQSAEMSSPARPRAFGRSHDRRGAGSTPVAIASEREAWPSARRLSTYFNTIAISDHIKRPEMVHAGRKPVHQIIASTFGLAAVLLHDPILPHADEWRPSGGPRARELP